MSYGDESRRPRTVDFTSSSLAIVFLAVTAGIALAAVVASGQRVVSWVIACAIAAALLELVVDWLDSYMRRAVAILIVLGMVGAAAGVLAFGILSDLDKDIKRLQFLARVSAHDIATTPQYEKFASDFDLETKVGALVDRLQSPSSGLAGRAVSSLATYLFCIILTVLFLSWGPRVLTSAAGELQPHQRARVKEVTHDAFNRARRYVALSMVQAFFFGTLAYLACVIAGLPASPPLAMTVMVFAFLPYIGILLGALPIFLLALGFTSPLTTLILAAAAIAAQLFSTFVVQRRVTDYSRLSIGPATIAISALLGFELYGAGGAVYAVSLAIMATAVLDAHFAREGFGPVENHSLESPIRM